MINCNSWVPISVIEEAKNTDIYTNILPFIRPLKLWIRDYCSAKKTRPRVNSTNEMPLQKQQTQQQPIIYTQAQSLEKIESQNIETQKKLEQLPTTTSATNHSTTDKEEEGQQLPDVFELIIMSFGRRLEKKADEFDLKMLKMYDDEAEKKEEKNPFLDFKLDTKDLSEAFQIKK